MGLALLLVVLAGGAIAVDKISGNDDTDGDGIMDSVDMCAGTIVDKPGQDWGVNRYLWIGEGFFTVLQASGGDKNKIFSEFSMAQTKGCSCLDIIKQTNTGKQAIEDTNDYKNGCTKGTVDGWIRNVNK